MADRPRPTELPSDQDESLIDLVTRYGREAFTPSTIARGLTSLATDPLDLVQWMAMHGVDPEMAITPPGRMETPEQVAARHELASSIPNAGELASKYLTQAGFKESETVPEQMGELGVSMLGPAVIAKAPKALSWGAKILGKASPAKATALTTDAFHGTRYDFPAFVNNAGKFVRGEKDGPFVLDQALGTHFAKDPNVSNTFADDIAEGGRVIPAKIPDEKTFLEVRQDLLPYITDRSTPRNPSNVHSDQSAIEKMIAAEGYKLRPDLLARYLVQARKMPEDVAASVAKKLAKGKSVALKEFDTGVSVKFLDTGVSDKSLWKINKEKKVNLKQFLDRYGGNPYNSKDRADLVDTARKSWQDKGYTGLKYLNTSPRETKFAEDPTSYIVFDPKHIRSRFAKFNPADSESSDLLKATGGAVRMGKGGLLKAGAEELAELAQKYLAKAGVRESETLPEQIGELGVSMLGPAAIAKAPKAFSWGKRILGKIDEAGMAGLPRMAGGPQRGSIDVGPIDKNERNEKFKKWFEKSAATIPKTSSRDLSPLEPMRLYHGTRGRFDVFEPREGTTSTTFGPVKVQRQGYFFAEDPEFASSFAEQSSSGKYPEGANVIPAYLSIKNPLWLDHMEGLSESDAKALINAGVDKRFVENYLGNADQTWEYFEQDWSPEFVEQIKKAGFDGVRMQERDPDSGKLKNVWIAFSPEQIKSPFNKTFDVNDPKFNSGGAVRMGKGGLLKAGAEELAELAQKYLPKVGKSGLPIDEASRMKRAEEMGMTTPAYHGSPRNITSFSNKYSSPEGHYGPHHYFTSNVDDVNANYAGEGPDLTNRIQREIESDQDGYGLQQYIEDQGLDYSDVEDDGALDLYAKQMAKERLGIENLGTVYPVKLRMKNPVVVGGPKETFFDYNVNVDDAGDVIDESGKAIDLINKTKEAFDEWQVDKYSAQDALEKISERISDGGITASEFDNAIRSSVNDLYDEYSGNMASPGALISDIFQKMGHDSIDMDASVFSNRRGFGGVKLPGMVGTENARHYIVFDPKNIRSRFAEFDPAASESAELSKASGGAVRKATGGLSRVNEAGNYTKPGMRKRLFNQIKARAVQGTKAGQWSARKAQLLAKKYKEQGGGYKD